MISNRIRFLIWGMMLFLGLIFSKAFLDKYVILKCPTYICIISGLLLFYIIFKVAGNTGKWLAKYGKEKTSKKFGDIQKLVTNGPYSCMRHPMHLFLSLLPISLGLILCSPSMSLIVGPIETLTILIMAIKIDEKESIERFGEKYLEYKETVPAFNFSIYCLKKVFEKP